MFFPDTTIWGDISIRHPTGLALLSGVAGIAGCEGVEGRNAVQYFRNSIWAIRVVVTRTYSWTRCCTVVLVRGKRWARPDEVRPLRPRKQGTTKPLGQPKAEGEA